ncbi:hypothetical protein E2C01_087543 [Portunus trituberculatus]|uniref:Uncharacterized protein n=1 Tax=Portunus trituberculatus TaxID=210409 RepID=A0A5B7JJK4_PORTR|nr:hypothetical protein [Portunus trituberculatus]
MNFKTKGRQRGEKTERERGEGKQVELCTAWKEGFELVRLGGGRRASQNAEATLRKGRRIEM